MKLIRAALIVAGTALACVLSVAVALLVLLGVAPQRFPTTAVAEAGLRVFGRKEHPSWSRLKASLRTDGRFSREFSLHAENVAFADAAGFASGRLKRVDFRASIRLSRQGVAFIRIHRLEVDGERLRLDWTKASGKALASGRPSLSSLESIESVRVRLPRLELIEKDARDLGAATLSFEASLPRPVSFQATWTRTSQGIARHGNVSATAVAIAARGRARAGFDFRLRAQSQGIRASLAVVARPAASAALELAVDLKAQQGSTTLTLSAAGTKTSRGYALTGSAAVEASSGTIKRVRFSSLAITAQTPPGEFAPNSIGLRAQLATTPVSVGLGSNKFRWAEELRGSLIFHARATPTPRMTDHFDADLDLTLAPPASWYVLRGRLKASAAGRTSRLTEASLDESAELTATVARFEDAVAFLADTPYAVPAPLNALRGPMRAQLKTSGDPRSKRQDVSVEFIAELAGTRQKLNLRVSGAGSAAPFAAAGHRIEGAIAAIIRDAAVQLPHLDVLHWPSVALDARISTPSSRAPAPTPPETTKSTAPRSFDYSVTTDKPVLFYTDLAATPIPVAFHLVSARPAGDISGRVEVSSFRVKVFRREATVDHLILILTPGSRSADVDGLLTYKATEARISIRLLGSSDKPRVEFESDPPLSRDEIIAMLLFGKSPNDLSSDQASSVANVQTAISDKAFGLASLYLFASTPLQFVGYDPVAKAYTMKFLIPGGETLELNSGVNEVKTIQLRKRLSEHFAIQAQAHTSQEQGNGVATFLEWFNRY
jgi:autotransporter translocation and assembly factor TamB